MSDRDRAMILDPDQWPAWPFLPMKKRDESGGWPLPGFFFCPSLAEDKVIFFDGNMYDAKNAAKTELTVDEVLAAGWVVD